MIRFYLLFAICCLYGGIGAHAQESRLQSPVVVIKSTTTGGFEEIGAGILVGLQSNTLFILTAKHVIENGTEINVNFYPGSQNVSAQLSHSSNRWDLALLICQRPSTFAIPASFDLADELPTLRQRVTTIGHPSGDYWHMNISNAVNALMYEEDDRLFTISPSGIQSGNSGGPILNESDQLMGILQRTDSRKAIGVSTSAIQLVLRIWQVPTNLLSGVASQDYNDPLVGDMVYVEGGSFQMGSEEGGKDERPVHTVNVPTFYIGKYEITQAQWTQIMGSNPSYFKDCDQCPVENVSWNDTQEFIQKLNQQSRYTYRLLTEAEWEYAAKGGKQQDNYVYAGSDQVDEVAWYGGNSESKTHPVGQKKANSLGIYDMSGNVWEWCEDWYHDSYKDAPSDGSAWLSPTGSNRVLRGGSWINNATSVRVALRYRLTPDYRRRSNGVRLARTP